MKFQLYEAVSKIRDDPRTNQKLTNTPTNGGPINSKEPNNSNTKGKLLLTTGS